MTSNDDQTDSPLTGPLLIDADEVARRLGVSTRTVWRLNSARKLPRPVTLGRSKKWRPEEIGRWVAAGCPPRSAWEPRVKRA
jgi:predicted DNA-binding transcriptional regulator AlpA